MSPDRLATELRPTFEGFRRVRLEQPLTRARMRLARLRATAVAPGAAAAPDDTAVTVVTVVEHAGARYRIHNPSAPSGAALLWMHGGGYVSGSAAEADLLCATIARRLGATVAAVDYRLAPRSPYPAALDDCLAAWDDLQHRADELGLDPRRVAVGGQSAGAGLAAALAQRLLDRGGVQPVAQWLSYAMLDDRTAADRSLDTHEHLVWDNRSNRFGWRSYLGRHDPALGYAVPARRTSLAGLPPAWIGVGDIDLFHAENVAYHRHLVASGVDATLLEVPGAPHGFDAIAPDTLLAREFQEAGLSWLAERAR